MKEYLIFCTACNEYTYLGQYLPKGKHFEGEYSLLYNQHTQDDQLLCQFLIKHVGHPLKAWHNQTEDYSRILRESKRFLDDEMDDYVYESYQRKLYLEDKRKREVDQSQVHFHVIERVLEEEAHSIAKTPTHTPAESQFWLGKEQGVRRAAELIKEWQEKLLG